MDICEVETTGEMIKWVWKINKGKGNWIEESPISFGVSEADKCVVGDFNGDGKPDLIQAGTTYYAKLGDVRFYANVSKGGGSSIKKESLSSVSISVQNKNLYVNGASGTMITVFDLSGIVYKTLKVVDDSTK